MRDGGREGERKREGGRERQRKRERMKERDVERGRPALVFMKMNVNW